MIQVAKVTNFKSFNDMLSALPDDKACREYLENIVWAGNPTCPHCKSRNHYKLTTKGVFKGMYKCVDCKKRYTVTVKTMFEGTRIPLRKWFIAIYIFTGHKKGISSHQLAKDLGITQKSAWFMLGRIRYAYKAKTISGKMTGVIQADETFVGGKNKNRHGDKKVFQSQGRSVKDKTPVFGLMQNGIGVRTFVVPDTKAVTLKPIIKEVVSAGALVVTDEWMGYSGLNKTHPHIVINHKQGEYVRGAFHTNGIENFWSQFKRGIYGIYHHASPKHLHRYCDEFTFRYNSRKINDSERFDYALRGIENSRLKYSELIGN